MPSSASFLKNNRPNPNFLKNPRGLPESKQRLRFLVENLGVFFDFSISALRAIDYPFKRPARPSLNGILNAFISAYASRSA